MARSLAVVLAGLLLLDAFTVPALAQTTEADVYVGQAIVDFDDKRYDAALENLKRALEIEPDHVEALYYTGVVYMVQRRPAAAVPFLERARAKSPKEPSLAYQLGLAYFALEQYDRALPLLEQAFAVQPELDSLGYYLGFLRYRNKNYRGALSALRAGRASDPEIQQLARVYTGLSLAALGLPRQAEAEVEQALRIAPGSAITGPAERLRDAVVASRDRDRRFTAEVRAGVLYDDNVRVLPGGIPLGSVDGELVAAIRQGSDLPEDSVGELFGVRAEYVWWRTADWESSVGYSFFATLYNDLPDFNITDHLVTATLVHKNAIAAMPLQIGLQYAYDALFLNEDLFIQRNTASLFGVLTESERHLTQLLARYQDKEFNEIGLTLPDESRDANNYMVGFQHFFRFAEDRHFIKVGYQWDRDDAEGKNYVYNGNRFLFGAQATLPWGDVRLRFDFDAHLRDYTHKNTLFPLIEPGTKRRSDQEYNYAFRVEVPLPWNLTLVAEYLRTDANSNLAIFDYDRNVTSLSLSWVY
ncbi:MAG TPA: tetratricopeptide repeat protein [Methylomirabilota bacterium]|nr:tetratricopeptide repeat protein [Methylomirabilota bacterium]